MAQALPNTSVAQGQGERPEAAHGVPRHAAALRLRQRAVLAVHVRHHVARDVGLPAPVTAESCQ